MRRGIAVYEAARALMGMITPFYDEVAKVNGRPVPVSSKLLGDAGTTKRELDLLCGGLHTAIWLLEEHCVMHEGVCSACIETG